MKVVQINATCGIGSTGKICIGISQLLTTAQKKNYILCSKTNGHPAGIVCADDKYIKLQALKSRILGNYGFNSTIATKKMIAELERIQPDIVHLHNIHGHDCNLQAVHLLSEEKDKTHMDVSRLLGIYSILSALYNGKMQPLGRRLRTLRSALGTFLVL